MIAIFRALQERIRDVIDPPFRASFIDDDPDYSAIGARDFLVLGTTAAPKYAYFSCPCRCGATIVLTTNRKLRPRWTIAIDKHGRPNVEPSVWRTVGCKSHFVLRRGRVRWC